MVKRIRRYFGTGLVVLIPLVITVFVLRYLFQFADNFLGTHVNNYLIEQGLIKEGMRIPGAGLIITLVIIILIGFLTTTILRGLWRHMERWVSRLPIVRHIYVPSRQLMHFLFAEERTAFRKAIAVEYPRKGIYSIGFLTSGTFNEIDAKTGKEFIGILIPSTPNPITSYFIMVQKEDIIYLDISAEDALRLIISGGILTPEEAKNLQHKEEPQLC